MVETLGFVRAMALASLCAGFPALASAQDTIIKSHSITTFGEPSKYPADFTHLDYVNPDAPKGGEISQATYGTFDSFNPYTQKGRAAALASSFFEDMMVGTADEI